MLRSLAASRGLRLQFLLGPRMGPSLSLQAGAARPGGLRPEEAEGPVPVWPLSRRRADRSACSPGRAGPGERSFHSAVVTSLLFVLCSLVVFRQNETGNRLNESFGSRALWTAVFAGSLLLMVPPGPACLGGKGGCRFRGSVGGASLAPLRLPCLLHHPSPCWGGVTSMPGCRGLAHWPSLCPQNAVSLTWDSPHTGAASGATPALEHSLWTGKWGGCGSTADPQQGQSRVRLETAWGPS